MIVGINTGVTGFQAIISVNDDHIFTDSTERDSYFSTNPSEKVPNTFIAVGSGFQQWDGTSWVDKTAVLRGETGGYGFTNGKGWILSSSMLPATSGSAYYLEGITPAQVFSCTEDQHVKMIINADELPTGTTTIKFRVEARHADATSPASRDVVWAFFAKWYNGYWSTTPGTKLTLTQTLELLDTKVAISSQTSAITIDGTEGTDDKLYIEVWRLGTDANDSLASDAYLTRIELEFA